MQLCLYHPVQGYYSRNANQFGKAGDFYTSSDVHAVFGRLLARQFDQIWQALDRTPQIEILELGPVAPLRPRRPRLVQQEVLRLLRRPDLHPARDLACPASQAARNPARAYWFRQSLRRDGRIHPSAEQSEAPADVCRTLAPDVPLIVFANEFFDALPVEILSPQGKLHIALADNRLHEIWLPPHPKELEFLDRYGVHPKPANALLKTNASKSHRRAGLDRQIASQINQGVLIAIDYGYTRNQQLAGRHRGTLMAYRHHSASSDPYQAPGEQDLTAHVNFTALAAECEQAGMRCEKLRTQSQFLMGIGESNQFADAFEDCRVPQEQAKVALQLKHLVTPSGMGENFQVFIATRGVNPNKVASLSGLSFGAS